MIEEHAEVPAVICHLENLKVFHKGEVLALNIFPLLRYVGIDGILNKGNKPGLICILVDNL